MPLLTYLVDTNVISDWLAGAQPVEQWLEEHRDQVAISTLTFAEMRQGIETKPQGKPRRQLERDFRFIIQDFAGAVWAFDEAAAFEWGRLMGESQAHNHPLPFADSLISAIARSMEAKVVSRDSHGFAGCVRIDPWTDLEYPAWES